MQRPASANTVILGNGKIGYGAGTPGVTPPTTLDSAVLNAVDEEIAGFIESTTAVLTNATYTQLLTAIRRMHEANRVSSGYASALNAALTPLSIAVQQSSVGAVVVAGATGATRVCSALPPGGTWASVASAGGYSGSFNVAIASNTTFVLAGTTHEIESSACSSVTWAQRTPANGYVGTFYGGCYGNSLFVLVGSGCEIQTSSDGTTWTHRAPGSGATNDLYSVCWSTALSIFVAVGNNGEIQTSPTGVTWTHRTTGNGYAGNFATVCVGKVSGSNGFMAVGAAFEMQWSTDGTTWHESVTGPAIYGAINVPSTSGGIWLATNNSTPFWSYDGITWPVAQIAPFVVGVPATIFQPNGTALNALATAYSTYVFFSSAIGGL